MLRWLSTAWRKPKLPFRRHFVMFALISFVAIAQLTWWSVFQFSEGRRLIETQNGYWQQQIVVAYQLRTTLGADFEIWLANTFPDLEIVTGGVVEVKPAARQKLEAFIHKRMRMFISEGAFFGLLVLAGVLFMFRTLREEIDIEHKQSVFLSAMSHELKTPITSLRMYVDTLRERELPQAKRAELLGVMSLDLNRLNDLIEQLLQAQRVLTPKTALPLERIDLSEETVRAVNDLKERILFSGKHRLNVDTEYGLEAMADPRRWQLVVKNLVDNAVKYAPAGGMIDVYLAKRDGKIELTVSDEGQGFAPDEPARLFERFYRIGDEDTRASQGVGLGLYLVKEIVSAMRGTVSAASPGPGKGSTFTVTVPEARNEHRA
ncbi:MAG: HAMP domain-containing histidine kinase [Calditrichaeota bacterium]|nr:HAMP domain-containing histidine kinase [Calditrichota bacterium]MCB9365592.1 HAMP domain-containing histidine kinase [Calditrichota bacterium]